MLAAGVVAAIGFLPSLVPSLRESDWWAGNSWRLVFFVGILPALLCFWIRRDVPEPEIWKARRAEAAAEAAAAGGAAPRPPRRRWSELMTPEERRHALLATVMNACAMFGYWGLFTWIPAYLKRPVEQGGRGLDLLATTTWLFVMFAGKFLGYSLFGFMADAFGRRRVYASYLFIAALLVPAFAYAPSAGWLLLLGPLVAFFGTGFFSGFSALAAEIFPTPIRASALGLTYNVGRGIAAFAPFVVGAISDSFSRSAPERGLATAFLFLAGTYLAAALLALRLPDSRGRELA
jgi:MFS family permease